MGNKTLDLLEEMKLEDLEEDDYLLIWDVSEQKTKKVDFQTLMDFIQMMNSQ